MLVILLSVLSIFNDMLGDVKQVVAFEIARINKNNNRFKRGENMLGYWYTRKRYKRRKLKYNHPYSSLSISASPYSRDHDIVHLDPSKQPLSFRTL